MRDIDARSDVGLSFQRKAGLLSMRPSFVTVKGKGEIVCDRARFAEHWHKQLERWRPGGIDTPGLAMIKVHASRLYNWEASVRVRAR